MTEALYLGPDFRGDPDAEESMTDRAGSQLKQEAREAGTPVEKKSIVSFGEVEVGKRFRYMNRLYRRTEPVRDRNDTWNAIEIDSGNQSHFNDVASVEPID